MQFYSNSYISFSCLVKESTVFKKNTWGQMGFYQKRICSKWLQLIHPVQRCILLKQTRVCIYLACFRLDWLSCILHVCSPVTFELFYLLDLWTSVCCQFWYFPSHIVMSRIVISGATKENGLFCQQAGKRSCRGLLWPDLLPVSITEEKVSAIRDQQPTVCVLSHNYGL